MRIRANVAEIFVRKFAGVVLIGTSGHDCPYGYCTISFQGTAQELLRHGLIDADMIPLGRKRSACSGRWDSEDTRRRGAWSIDREHGGVLVVWRDLAHVVPTHPLWAVVTSERRRPLAQQRKRYRLSVSAAAVSFAG